MAFILALTGLKSFLLVRSLTFRSTARSCQGENNADLELLSQNLLWKAYERVSISPSGRAIRAQTLSGSHVPVYPSLIMCGNCKSSIPSFMSFNCLLSYVRHRMIMVATHDHKKSDKLNKTSQGVEKVWASDVAGIWKSKTWRELYRLT